MSDSLRPAAFQQAAIDHIVSRLRDKHGSRRFLLADEVGLGKTVVARGVIKAFSKRRAHLKIIYLCSNAEIGEQNRRRLTDDGGTSITRVTELALQQPAPDMEQLLALTPGTSLRGGTGLAWERRLLMFLLNRTVGIDTSLKDWRTFFRCGAGQKSWESVSASHQVHAEFNRKTSGRLQIEFRDAVRSDLYSGRSLLEVLRDAVEAFNVDDPAARSTRNKLISALRSVLQRVALRSIAPDLIVLDEIQRFKEVIDQAANKEALASELFATGAPVLILSATPYKLYTADLEAKEFGAHHEDFFGTLRFLFGKDTNTPRRIARDLKAFGTRLRTIDLQAPRDDTLLTLKRSIESNVRRVVCRTERNWYVLDAKRGVAERGPEASEFPGREELREYFDIHRGLANDLEGSAQVTEFWKSSPSLLTFMDGAYSLTKRLRKPNRRVPRALLTKADDLSLPKRNQRLRRLLDHTLGNDGAPPQLWTRPTYAYYRDDKWSDPAPRKMLVFSGWRFVPKTISVVLSQAAAARVRGRADETRQPLRLTEKQSFHVFDVCYPSWALSGLANPRIPNLTQDGPERTADALLRATQEALRRRLREVGVTVAETSNGSLWRVVARLEASVPEATLIRAALDNWTTDDDDSTDATEFHRDLFLKWFNDLHTPLSISERDIGHLAMSAVFSPAVAVLRALKSVYSGAEIVEAMPALLRLCFGSLRRYFNRPLNQQTIRDHRSRLVARKRGDRTERAFTRRVLRYAADHHFQAVVDEHTYLLRHCGSCGDARRAIAQYDDIWSLGRGSRRTNGASGSGSLVRLSHDAHVFQTHFALAFGEEVVKDAAPGTTGDDRIRRSVVREAFNSPFWPFVLATTSVGQEGLDFHLHCRDVFHWNLPSNPVDLEQREGRVNRRDGLAVRTSIARDWPLASVAGGLQLPDVNPWKLIFERLDLEEGPQRYKHGLYPHWIYDCRDSSRTAAIERHVAFFVKSRDAQRYERLKLGLALYRLVFGQANQEDLLGDLAKRLSALAPAEQLRAQRRLAGYMLNLSPIGAAEALRFANEEAQQLLAHADTTGLERLMAHVAKMCLDHQAELAPALKDIEVLLSRVRTALKSGDRRSHGIRKTVTALANLRNPYDQFFDLAAAGGFDDDIRVVRLAAKR